MDEPRDEHADGPASAEATPAPEEILTDDELLVEEVSIDGMCGVY